MIKNTELRIGNMLMFDGNYIEVTEVTNRCFKADGIFHEYGEKEIELVALCENTVQQLGLHSEWTFKVYTIDIDSPDNIQLRVNIDEEVIVSIGSQFDKDLYLNIPHVKYVHQLQNLYNLMTGKELATIFN